MQRIRLTLKLLQSGRKPVKKTRIKKRDVRKIENFMTTACWKQPRKYTLYVYAKIKRKPKAASQKPIVLTEKWSSKRGICRR